MEQKTKNSIGEAGGLLIRQGLSIAVAESVTAGNIQAAFSLAKNAIRFFRVALLCTIPGKKPATCT